MSASEKDREAAWAAIYECELGTTMSTFAEKMAEAIATARAEGETAGYAKGRREAFSEAAEIAATFAPPGGYDTNTFGGVAAMKAGDDIAAALRAKADADAPHE